MTQDLKPESVKGFAKLSPSDQETFKAFLRTYLSQYEHPERHFPVKVKATRDGNGPYLRVDFGGDYWLHVKSPVTWY